MPEERLLNLFFLNAAAVVGDADKINAAALDLDGHRRGTGVHRVFHQLLHDRSRPLHYFARGDLINRILIQYIYYSHGFLLSAGDSPPVHFLCYYSACIFLLSILPPASYSSYTFPQNSLPPTQLPAFLLQLIQRIERLNRRHIPQIHLF